jgi:hypothetical protein
MAVKPVWISFIAVVLMTTVRLVAVGLSKVTSSRTTSNASTSRRLDPPDAEQGLIATTHVLDDSEGGFRKLLGSRDGNGDRSCYFQETEVTPLKPWKEGKNCPVVLCPSTGGTNFSCCE